MKKVLLFNRRIVRHATPVMFTLGCVLVVIMGLTILTGSPAKLNITGDLWLGYLYIFIGLVLIVAFSVDTLLGALKPHKKRKALQDRIKSVELNQ